MAPVCFQSFTKPRTHSTPSTCRIPADTRNKWVHMTPKSCYKHMTNEVTLALLDTVVAAGDALLGLRDHRSHFHGAQAAATASQPFPFRRANGV
jgi:hypothetical protein